MSETPAFTVVRYPDPVLRKVAQPVPAFDDELLATVADMFRTMYADGGVGLAAPQVGLRQRILVLNPTGDASTADDELALVNVTITDRSGPKSLMEEGCLSFPGIYAEIERPELCTVEAFDPAGKPLQLQFEGFASRIVQHEYDHLEGVLLVDRMSPAEKVRNKALLQDLVDDYKELRAASGSGG